MSEAPIQMDFSVPCPYCNSRTWAHQRGGDELTGYLFQPCPQWPADADPTEVFGDE